MTQLKKSILQAAVQGKLISQDPADEPASALLVRIRAERKKFEKTGKIKKDPKATIIYRAPRDGEDAPHTFYERLANGTVRDITEEIPFAIPESWEWARLKSLCTKIGSGSTPTGGRTVYKNSGIKFIRSQNVYNDGLLLDNVAYIPESINQRRLGSFVYANDILLNITGASIGRCAIVPDNFGGANINQHVMIIRLCDPGINSLIHAVLISGYIQNLIMGVQVGVSREGLSATKLMEFLIPLPPLAEQHRIVARLKELLARAAVCDAAEKKLTALDAAFPARLKKSILRAAVQGKLISQDPADEPASALLVRIRAERKKLEKTGKIKKDPKATIIYRAPRDGEDAPHTFYERLANGTVRDITDEIPFAIPESWEWARLGDVFNVIMGQSPDGKSVSESMHGIEFHQGKVFFGTSIIAKSNQTTAEPTKIAPAGSVLLCVRAPVGKVNMTDRELCIGRGLCAIQPLAGISVNFIFRLLEAYENIFIKQATGTTFIAVTGEVVKKQLFPLPPLAEQHRIVQRIEELLARVHTLDVGKT
ncbi:MAG: restriction endonuclease subunit S [Spirochaetota bacterium]|jgi:type I restriction enzyme S subunit|nr:restriction endonuclease subunit S [Spirochaetota bacterium]